jgi:hypothetical protein
MHDAILDPSCSQFVSASSICIRFFIFKLSKIQRASLTSLSNPPPSSATSPKPPSLSSGPLSTSQPPNFAPSISTATANASPPSHNLSPTPPQNSPDSNLTATIHSNSSFAPQPERSRLMSSRFGRIPCRRRRVFAYASETWRIRHCWKMQS